MPTYKTHDHTVLFDARRTGAMAILKEALDNIEGWFQPDVIVVLTITDDTTKQEYPAVTFPNLSSFHQWRSNFERIPDSRPMIEWFAEKQRAGQS